MSNSFRHLIPSFARRHGRGLNPQEKRLLADIFPSCEIQLSEENELSLASLFPKTPSSYWLEIGFGGGEHLAAQAQQHPEVGLIGCEPYINGVVKLLRQIEQHNLQNIRLFTNDARLLMQHLPEHSFERIFILFPDPWPKLRHHKRRIVNTYLLDLCARAMKEGGLLCLATDHEGYAEWMLEHLLIDHRFKWTAISAKDFLEPPDWWVETRYQKKTAEQGRRANFFIFEYVEILP